jgi:hypothetical protein
VFQGLSQSVFWVESTGAILPVSAGAVVETLMIVLEDVEQMSGVLPVGGWQVPTPTSVIES